MAQISVIVPVYNAEDSLELCVESVLAQTFTDLELLLIDDGSTDGSGALCDAFGDERVRVFHRENGGPSRARNFGMAQASGSYLCFVDADDYLEPEALRLAFACAQQTKAELVIYGYFCDVERDGELALQQEIFMEDCLLASKRDMAGALIELKTKHLLDAPWNKLYQRAALLQSGVEMPLDELYEDTAFHLRLLPQLGRVAVLKTCLYHYRQRFGSITRHYNPQKYETLKNRYQMLLDCAESLGGDAGLFGFCHYYFVQSALSCLIDLYFPSARQTAKQRRRRIRQVLRDPVFDAALRQATARSQKERGVLRVARTRSVLLLSLFCRYLYHIKFEREEKYLRLKQKKEAAL